LALLVATPAAASPAPVPGLSWLLGLNQKLEAHLTANCTFPDTLDDVDACDLFLVRRAQREVLALSRRG
jgi:hypothetical protein